MEEIGENHQPWASNWETLSLAVASRVGTHTILVIALYELLSYPVPTGNSLSHPGPQTSKHVYIDQSETRMPVAAMIFVRSKLHKDILKRTFHTSLLQIFGSN